MTAGLMCAPETQPKIWTQIKTANPKLKTTCNSDGPDSFQKIQLEQPKNTSKAVPNNSLKNTATLSELKGPLFDDFAILTERTTKNEQI